MTVEQDDDGRGLGTTGHLSVMTEDDVTTSVVVTVMVSFSLTEGAMGRVSWKYR